MYIAQSTKQESSAFTASPQGPLPNPTYSQQKEKHALLLMRGGRRNQHAAFRGQIRSPWDHSSDVRMALVLVDHEVLCANQHPARSISPPRDCDQAIGAIINSFGVLSYHVVKAEVQFVEGQLLLSFTGCLTGRVLRGWEAAWAAVLIDHASMRAGGRALLHSSP